MLNDSPKPLKVLLLPNPNPRLVACTGLIPPPNKPLPPVPNPVAAVLPEKINTNIKILKCQ